MIALVFHAIDHFLEAWVARLQDHFLFADVQVPILLALHRNTIVERQRVHLAKCLSIFDSLLTALKSQFVVPLEEFVHKGVQCIVKVVVLQLLIKGQSKRADELLELIIDLAFDVRAVSHI